jgi:glycosyltransferase involved in cell wall biosynthesis
MIATELQEETEQVTYGEPPKVAVVVPSYNHARFIEAALRSIIKQTLWPAQLVVIDDGSRDNSPVVIERLLNDCPFPCELIVRENRGLPATLNEGFQRTRGDYFAYLGSDDLWLPGFLSARVALLATRPAAVLAYGHAYYIDEENAVVDTTADWAHYADGEVRKMLLQTTAPMSPTVVYRRDALARERWNEASKLEDYDLYLRLSAVGEFAFDPRILSAWRRHGSNVSWDQGLMLREQLRAQREAALRFGFSEKELKQLQRTTRFLRAEDFLRVGDKATAVGLLLQNVRGANSPRATARMLARLLLPNVLLRRRARARERKVYQRYGSL